MTRRQERCLLMLARKVKEFRLGRNIDPNAMLISIDEIDIIGEIDRDLLQKQIPEISCFIPAPRSPALRGYDLPLPILLPEVVTKSQRERNCDARNRTEV